MTANDPSRQQEATNHGDAELPGQSMWSNRRARRRRCRRFQPERARTPQSPARSVISDALRGFSQLFAPGVTLPTFNPATSNDRPAYANGGVVVQKPLVRISMSAVSRLRRWIRRPPFCQRADLEFAQRYVPGPRDSWTLLHSSDRAPPLPSRTTDYWQGLHPDGRLPS